MPIVLSPPFTLADVRQVDIACASDPALFHTHVSACGSDPFIPEEIRRWLTSTTYRFTDSKWGCGAWIEVTVDLRGEDDKKVVHIPTRLRRSEEGQVERSGPSDEIVEWEDFEHAMRGASWTDCDLKGNNSPTNDASRSLSSEEAGISQLNLYHLDHEVSSTKLEAILAFVQVGCGEDKALFSLEKYCPTSNTAANAFPDISRMTNDIHSFLGSQCRSVLMWFHTRGAWEPLVGLRHAWMNEGNSSARWNRLDSTLSKVPWPTCSQIIEPAPNLPLPVPPQAPYLPWITSDNMYNDWKLEPDAFAVAECPGPRYHYSPNYSNMTRPEEGATPIWNLAEWLSVVESCVTSASDAGELWIPAKLVWSETEDTGYKHKAMFNFFIVTQHWEETDKKEPLVRVPNGKRIRWDNFVIKMGKQEWSPPRRLWSSSDMKGGYPKMPADPEPSHKPDAMTKLPLLASDITATYSISSYVASNPFVLIFPLAVIIYLLARLIRWRISRTLSTPKDKW